MAFDSARFLRAADTGRIAWRHLDALAEVRSDAAFSKSKVSLLQALRGATAAAWTGTETGWQTTSALRAAAKLARTALRGSRTSPALPLWREIRAGRLLVRDDFSLVTRMVGDSTFGEFRKAVRRINSKAPNYDDQVGAALAATANELMGRIEPCPFCVACTLDDFQGFVMEFIGRWLFHGHPQYRENAARDVFLPGRILFPVSAATSANDEKLRWLWAHEEAHRLLLASRHRGSFEVLYAAVLELAEGIPAPARLRAHGFQESNLREFLATALGDRTEPLEDWSEFWVRTSEPLIFAAADEISGFARPFVRPCWDSVLATAKKLRPELHADLLKAQMEADRVRAAAEIEAEADLAATRAHGFACCE